MELPVAPKICVPIDRYFYGPNKGPFPGPKSVLLDQAQAFAIKHPLYLRAYNQLKFLGENPKGIRAQELQMLKRVVDSGLDVTFHCGSGLEDHLFVKKTVDGKKKIIEDRGFNEVFVKQRLMRDLNAVKFASFSLAPSSRNTIVNADTGEWCGDRETPLHEHLWMQFFKEKLRQIRAEYVGLLGFENTPLHPGYGKRDVQNFIANPGFITRALLASESLYLLLDIAHAKVSSRQFGHYFAEEYLRSLPLTRVMEIHISGTETRGGEVFERHAKPEEEDLELLSWVIRSGAEPRYITIEDYAADEAGLSIDIDEIKDFLANQGAPRS